ncbi:MAG: HAD family hydrolase [Bacteroidia bacterium]|jgi:putative hydrolase of the HAD superfamily|nr:HAD family hydrolase [Bacteroidia bacterium]
MIESHGIIHVSFDLWMTLIASDPEFKPKRDALLASRFGIKAPQEEVSATLRRMDKLFDHVSVVCGQTAHYESLILLALDALGADAAKVQPETLNGFYDEMEELFFKHPPRLLNSDTAETFEMLQERNISISLLSNTGFIKGRTLRKRLEQLGLSPYFNFLLFSDEHGAAKPSPAFFGSAFEAVNAFRPAQKHEILHIGDNEVADVKGALNFGFRSLLYDKEVTSLRTLTGI